MSCGWLQGYTHSRPHCNHSFGQRFMAERTESKFLATTALEGSVFTSEQRAFGGGKITISHFLGLVQLVRQRHDANKWLVILCNYPILAGFIVSVILRPQPLVQ